MARVSRTGWFPCETRPAHPGIYEVRFGESVLFSFWNGICWSLLWPSLKTPAQCWGYISRFQNLSWRGLKSPPAST